MPAGFRADQPTARGSSTTLKRYKRQERRVRHRRGESGTDQGLIGDLLQAEPVAHTQGYGDAGSVARIQQIQQGPFRGRDGILQALAREHSTANRPVQLRPRVTEQRH